MDIEHVFNAVADHHRRHLLHILAQADGQTLSQLCSHLPMTRIGVMKHLRVLEEAGLIFTRKVGRKRLHYLNPSPLQEIVEWASQFRRMREESYDRLGDLLRTRQAETDPTETENTFNHSDEETNL